jgi:hypothetical protein
MMDLLLWTFFIDWQIMQSDYTRHKTITAYKKKVILTERVNSSAVHLLMPRLYITASFFFPKRANIVVCSLS